MKRRIIKQGHNTLTLTLPSKWSKKLNLKAGDEVDMIEKGNTITILTNPKEEERTTNLDISDKDIPTIWKFIMSIYREGYDEVIVKFNPEAYFESPYKLFTQHSLDKKYEEIKLNPIELLEEFIHRFIGFEIIKHGQDYCVIRDMGEISNKEFDSSLRRVFLLIQQMGEELLEALNIKNAKILKHTHDVDINLDKFHDYCIRVMNKTHIREQQKNSLLFSTLYILEILGDEFKNISNHILREEKEIRFENIKDLAELVVSHFNSFYEIYYKFSSEKSVKMSEQDMEIYYYLPKLYKKKKNKNDLTNSELEIFNHLRRISRYINALLELRIEMEYSR